MISSRFLRLSLPPLLFICFCHHGYAFYPNTGDDMDMDFMNKDPNVKADINKMMLMNSDDPKLRSEAEEAFQAIMRAKRLTKLQECRQECVAEHEPADEFRGCNAKCEATNKPGEYAELTTLKGGAEASPPAEKEKKTVEKKDETSSQEKKAEL